MVQESPIPSLVGQEVPLILLHTSFSATRDSFQLAPIIKHSLPPHGSQAQTLLLPKLLPKPCTTRRPLPAACVRAAAELQQALQLPHQYLPTILCGENGRLPGPAWPASSEQGHAKAAQPALSQQLPLGNLRAPGHANAALCSSLFLFLIILLCGAVKE